MIVVNPVYNLPWKTARATLWKHLWLWLGYVITLVIVATHSNAGSSKYICVVENDKRYMWLSDLAAYGVLTVSLLGTERNTPQTQGSSGSAWPMSLACMRMNGPPTRGLVKMSASIRSVGTWCNSKSPLFPQSILMYLVLATPWLAGYLQLPWPARHRNHVAQQVIVSATNSASVELCLIYFSVIYFSVIASELFRIWWIKHSSFSFFRENVIIFMRLRPFQL